MNGAELSMSVTADHGGYTSKYRLKQTYSADAQTLTVLAPSELAGLSVTVREDGTVFEYAGAVIDTGILNFTELSPLSVLPAVVRQWKEGVLGEASPETLDGVRAVSAVFDTAVSGTELVFRSWFTEDGLVPLKTEIYRENQMIMICRYETASIH